MKIVKMLQTLKYSIKKYYDLISSLPNPRITKQHFYINCYALTIYTKMHLNFNHLLKNLVIIYLFNRHCYEYNDLI